MNDIESKYDASKHPDVIAKKRTSAEVLRYVDMHTVPSLLLMIVFDVTLLYCREFLDTFDQGDKDGKVCSLSPPPSRRVF